MSKRLSLLFTMLLVSGCSNMGNIHRTQHIYNNEYVTVHEAVTAKSSECPKYIPLPIYFAPEVPLEKLRHAATKGEHDVILTMTKYIRELRENIAKRKKEEQQHYENYLKSCTLELK